MDNVIGEEKIHSDAAQIQIFKGVCEDECKLHCKSPAVSLGRKISKVSIHSRTQHAEVRLVEHLIAV